MPKELKTKDIKHMHTELGHPLEDNTQAKGNTMVLHLTGMFKPCKTCASDKARETELSKMAPCSIIKGERMTINISSPSTTSTNGKKHLLLLVGDYTDLLEREI